MPSQAIPIPKCSFLIEPMSYTPIIQEAARLWHERIGQFISDLDWGSSLSASYLVYKSKVNKAGNEISMGQRLGICGTSVIMIDADEAVLIDRIDLSKVRATSVLSEGRDFKYGESTVGVHNVYKTQINWALDERRVYPLLLVRPGKASSMKALAVSHTDDQVFVCVPNESFSFEPKKVRIARDYIQAAGLQTKWRKAAQLRQTIGLGDHLGTARENALIAEHAAMLELFPLDVWLPEVGSGNETALGDCLAIKPGLDLEHLPWASKLISKKTVESTNA